jgi:putative proteasome-type protease
MKRRNGGLRPAYTELSRWLAEVPLEVFGDRRREAEWLFRRIEPGERYFQDLRERWSSALRAADIAIPRPPDRTPE